MKVRWALVYLLAVIAALLAGYGASYGVRPSNLVFIAGVVLLVCVALVEALTLRRMLAVPIGVTVVALFFFVIGYPTLSLPVCPESPGPVACAGEGARDRTLWALGAFVVGAVLTIVLAVPPGRTEPS